MFPNYKRKFLIFKVPGGWKDLGEIDSTYSFENGQDMETTRIHEFCKRIVNIGSENGELFRFCPQCMIKTTDKPKKIIDRKLIN